MDLLQEDIWTFNGGIRLEEHKAQSTLTPITKAPLPELLYIPLQQHIGNMTEPVVKNGEYVFKGQVLAKVQDYLGAPIHAPTSGKIVAIEKYAVPHPSGLFAMCVVLKPDGKDEWGELPIPYPEYEQISKSELRERIRGAGIVGMGGAAFPTAIKLNAIPGKKMHTLIINGVECEPYITCDDMLMREQPCRIIAGIRIIMAIIECEQCLIGIEDNKPQAITAMRVALADEGDDRIKLIVVPTKYPSGGEKQLIKILTGKEVPSSGIPPDIGFVCQNVATAASVADAVLAGRPLVSRVITVTGEGIKSPCNLEVLIGTPINHIIKAAGGYTDQADRLILGGPMMGFTLSADTVPVTKSSNCLLVKEKEVTDEAQECIRCGRCAEVCPVHLLPQQLYWQAKAKRLDKTQDYHLFDCIECGCCSYVCPSHIPLVQYYRYAKTESWEQEREREKSELAKQRHESREARLARLAAERKARLRKKKEALGSDNDDSKKAAIAAAMKRVQKKKAEQE